MRFGCCGSMIAPAADPVGIEVVESMAAVGFDYIELSLADIAALAEDRFLAICRRLERAGIPCEACNNFFPPSVRLTGEDARPDRALDYARRALERAARLGARVVVFGSAGAKNVPPGFDRSRAWGQIAELLHRLGPVAQTHGITIAIEAINRTESNIVNRVAEGMRLARDADHPNIQVMADYYHLALEQEDPAVVTAADPAIRHVHVAQVDGRRFPRRLESETMLRFFDALRRIRYAGRCSIEGYTDAFAADARAALAFLREAAGLRDGRSCFEG